MRIALLTTQIRGGSGVKFRLRAALFAFFEERGVINPGRNNGRGNYHSDERKGDKQVMHFESSPLMGSRPLPAAAFITMIALDAKSLNPTNTEGNKKSVGYGSNTKV
jgi:hypothetical protein